jgi:hypothetical protein
MPEGTTHVREPRRISSAMSAAHAPIRRVQPHHRTFTASAWAVPFKSAWLLIRLFT